MHFEKLNKDKIRITLSHDDLQKKDIDLHSFMTNSIESQDLFYEMLDEAEKEIGFVTKDYLIRIEAIAVAGGDFIFTVTRSLPKKQKKLYIAKSTYSHPNKNVQLKKKVKNLEPSCIIYSFGSFDDFCSFIIFYKNNFKSTNLAKGIYLYEYNSNYYLVLNKININFDDFKRFFSCISEFAFQIKNSEIFECKLQENGKLIMKHNAISTSLKYFAN